MTSDREIIDRVLSGDRDGFHALIQRHGGPIWSTLRSSLANREDAREVFQETWTRAFERLESLREPGRLRSWLLSIALNLVRQRLRRPRPVPLEPGGWEGEEGPPADDEPVGEGLERRELGDLLRAEIEGLPRRQREVMDLRVNHELSHAEIARQLGITEEGSRANLYQALRRLRARFERLEREP